MGSFSGILIALLTALPALLVASLLKLARYIKTHDAYLEMDVKRLNLMDEQSYCLELDIQNETKKDLLLKDLCLVNKEDEVIASLKSEPFLKKGDAEDRIYKTEDGIYSLFSVSNSSLTALYSFKMNTISSPIYLCYRDENGKRFYGKLDGNIYQKKAIRFSNKKN